MITAPVLVGDGIENSNNAMVMQDAAEMFGTVCHFRDPKGLAGGWHEAEQSRVFDIVSTHDVMENCRPLIALDNGIGAQSVYGFQVPKGARPTLVAGNERRGLSHEILTSADSSIEIPMVSRRLNTINVAAASAIGLYYLTRKAGGQLFSSANPAARRPTLFVIGGSNHVELGSTLRSAAAFGWENALIDDRAGCWFRGPHSVRTEGRAAARSYRNPIRLESVRRPSRRWDEVLVVSVKEGGVPLSRANLARGRRVMLAIPDESAIDAAEEPWDMFGRKVRFVRVELATAHFSYHLRLIASIALAEAARQIGRKPSNARKVR